MRKDLELIHSTSLQSVSRRTGAFLFRHLVKPLPRAILRLYCLSWCCFLLSLAAPESVIGDTCANFGVQYLVLAGLALFFSKGSSRLLALVLGILIIIATYPYLVPSSTVSQIETGKDSGNLSLASVNLFRKNGAYARAGEWIDEMKPDILALIELTPEWSAGVKSSLKSYPFGVEAPARHDFGIGLLSKYPITRHELRNFTEAGPTSIVAQVEFHNRQILVVATHPVPPASLSSFRSRNNHLAALAQLINEWNGPAIVLGDLNLTPLSSYYERFLANSGLQDTRRGRGLNVTWPTYLPFAFIPIDHILPSHHFKIQGFRSGRYIGSDHLPVSANLLLP